MNDISEPANIRTGLFEYLNGCKPIADLVTGIYPLKIPQSENLPGITYRVLNLTRDEAANRGETGYVNATIQINCWARKYEEAVPVVRQLRLALGGFRGRWGETEIRSCHVIGEHDNYEEPQFADDVGFPGVGIDVEVAYLEDRPDRHN